MDKDQATTINPTPDLDEVNVTQQANSSGVVMDIQAPKPSVVNSVTTAIPVSEDPASPAPDFTQNTSNDEPVIVQEPSEATIDSPATPESVGLPTFKPETDEVVASTPATLTNSPQAGPSSLSSESGTELNVKEENPLAIAPQPHKQKGAPILAVIMAIIVALALSGVAVFMYLKSNEAKKAADTSKTTNQKIIEKPQASASDVDATSKEIDASLQAIDDSKDFSNAELSDTSLGL